MSVPDTLLPSPPTTSSRHQKLFFGLPKPVTDTPEDSPASLLPSSGDNSRKKVEFSPWTTNISESLNLTPNTESATFLKDLPPSRDCQPTARPILKPGPSTENIHGLDGQQEEPNTIEKMESLLQQLSHNDRPSSIDAYQTMTALIKVYDEPPEEAVLKAKMSSLQKYIKRDLVVLDVPGETLQNEERLLTQNLVMSALKVLVTMVWSGSFSPYLSDDFRAWTVERSIHVLKEHSLPKASLLHYIHLLATQNYRSSIMSTNNRAARLLEVLQELTKHVTGKAVLSERLLVYQKLIDQAKPLMKSKAGFWIKDVVTAMTHSFKEVRNNAISVATRIYTAFPGSPSIAHALRSTLSQTAGDRSLSASLTNRLERIIAAKDDAVQVPQVWALVLLMCNSMDTTIDSWPELMDWLRLIQRCFNCSDLAVRLQGFLAWNRFIYIARPHEASEKMLSMLAKPVIAQLDRTGNSVSGKGSRPAAVSSYCTLLYYAFRPTSSHKQITRAWNEYIVKVMTSEFLSKSTSNCDLSSRVLLSLFWNANSSPKVWNENRAHENTQVNPEEVPTIDCKWIRSKASSILDLFQVLVRHSSFGPTNYQSDQAFVAQAWKHFLRAIRDSASKEIKQSVETKSALKKMLEFLGQCQIDDAIDSKTSFDGNVSLMSRSKLLCSMLLLEMNPVTILETLESSPSPRSALIVGELLKVFRQGSNHTNQQQRLLSLPSTTQQMVLDRSLALLNDELLTAYNIAIPNSVESIHTLLEISINTVRHMPSDMVLHYLKILQPGLAILIRDDKEAFASSLKSTSPSSPHYSLCSVAVDRMAEIQLNQFEVLDDLFASLLSSSNQMVTKYVLDAWNKTIWQEEPVLYGPNLLREIERIRTKSSISLPGIQPTIESDSISVPTFQQDVENNVEEVQQAVPDQIPLPEPHTIEQISKKVITDLQRANSPDQLSGTGTPPKKVRHDDSQIQFVPVESSPLDNTVESQLLSGRQKDVREKQRSEPAVTFADIRSSPRTHGRSSKSVECEISRKAASKEQSPATPTLPSGHPVNEYDDPPTPTPKARQHVNKNLLPDIMSSPSSIQDAAEQQADDITSSPLKDGVQNQDAIQLDEEQRISTEESEISVSKAAEYCIVEMIGEGERNLGSSLEDEVPESQQAHVEPLPADLDVHVEKIADACYMNNVNGEIASPEGSYSDEIDAMAAHQLSQDHELYSQDQSAENTASPPQLLSGFRKRRNASNSQLAEEERPRKRRSASRDKESLPISPMDDGSVASSVEQNLPLPDSKSGRISLEQIFANTKTSSPRKTRSKSQRKAKGLIKEHPVIKNPASPSNGFEEHCAIRSKDSSMPEERHGYDPGQVNAEVRPATENKGLAARLQQILEDMEADKGMDIDLVAVHSMCFKIGLKAQILATAQEQNNA